VDFTDFIRDFRDEKEKKLNFEQKSEEKLAIPPIGDAPCLAAFATHGNSL